MTAIAAHGTEHILGGSGGLIGAIPQVIIVRWLSLLVLSDGILTRRCQILHWQSRELSGDVSYLTSSVIGVHIASQCQPGGAEIGRFVFK